MAEVTEFHNMTRKQTIDLISALFAFERDRALRVTQITDEFGLDAEPVPGGLFRVFPNGRNYDLEYHGRK